MSASAAGALVSASASASVVASASDSTSVLPLGSIDGFGHPGGTGTVSGFAYGTPLRTANNSSSRLDLPGARVVDAESAKLPLEVINRVIRANSPRLRSCYETARKKNPTLEVQLTVRVVIAADGSTKSARLEPKSDTSDADFQRCVLGVLETLAYPEPVNGAMSVLVPMQFTIAKDAGK